MNRRVFFADYKKDLELELLGLWRSSFNRAVGIAEDVRAEASQEHLKFLRSLNPGFIRVALEETTSQLLAFMRKEGSEIKDLFVHVEHQREGLGSEFIRQAKAENDFLFLSTFELNKGAQRFYEFHDFVVTRRGFAGAEDNPWATTREQLADITYEWKRADRG
jgi:ribosomal protein S18 acetylase RimI-like enzyme